MSTAAPDGQVRRGLLHLSAAKAYFIAAGAILELRLPALLGRTTYGAYGVVSSLVSPLNNVVVTATIMTVSRFTARDPTKAEAVERAGLRMQLLVGLPLALALAAASPLLAGLLRDPSKAGAIALGALVVAAYSFYAVFVGSLNGRRWFRAQAALDVTFATLRAGAMLGMAAAGAGLIGALIGWVATAFLIALIAAVVVARAVRSPAAEAPPVRLAPMLGFVASVAIYHAALNLIMVSDQLLLKRLATQWFLEHGESALASLRSHLPAGRQATITHLDFSSAADAQVGYYRAAQTLARLPYQVIVAGTFVVFPLIARSAFHGEREQVARVAGAGLRFALIAATGIAVILAANPAAILDLLYATDYAQVGWVALIALALGNVALALLAVIGTVLNAAAMTRVAVVLTGMTLLLAVAASALVIPTQAPGRAMLAACAFATAGATVAGALVGAVVVRRRLGAGLALGTLARVILAAVIAVAAGRAVTTSAAVGTVLESMMVAAVFLLVLIATREVAWRDVVAPLRALGRISDPRDR